MSNTDAVLDSFLKASVADRLRMVQKNTTATTTVIKDFLGESAYREYRRLAEKLDEHHLGVHAPPNLVFVPGVMGSLLTSQTKGGVWWIDLRELSHIDDLRLAPNGKEDADETNQIRPFASDMSYEPFHVAVLERDDFGHETFAYDWRKPLLASAAMLRDCIIRMHERNGGEPVHLVGHSMGGLTIRTTLMEYGKELWPRLGRIVFIGTPHYGAPAIAGYLKNHLWGFEMLALLGLYLSRETFRSLWGVLSLLPAPVAYYPGTRPDDKSPLRFKDPGAPYEHPCANFDLYQAEAWKLGLTSEQEEALQHVLDGAADFHHRLRTWHEGLSQERRDAMLVIAGVGYKTLFRLANVPGFLGLWESMEKVTAREQDNPHRDGDGRVPLASATLENVASRFVKGAHSALPNILSVQRDVFAWLSEKELKLPDTPKQALGAHLAADDIRSIAPVLDDTARSDPSTDDPGLWGVDHVSKEQLTALRKALENGQLPEFTRVKLL
jgi:pimeloyl-ACP methyl ester carboxylesterase